MTERTEHTNTLPWQADPNDDYWILGGAAGGKVAEVTFLEDRPLVVRAVNVHDELVAALEWIDAYLANQPLDQQAKFLITEKVKEALAKEK